MPKRKSPFSQALDSFIGSINQTGEGNSTLTAIIFLAGGVFGTYIGYTDHAVLLLGGGLLLLLIGVMVGYRSLSRPSRRRR